MKLKLKAKISVGWVNFLSDNLKQVDCEVSEVELKNHSNIISIYFTTLLVKCLMALTILFHFRNSYNKSI